MQSEKTIPSIQNTLVFWGPILIGTFALMSVAGCGPVDAQQASENVIRNLNYNFFLQEATELSRNYDDRRKARTYFIERKEFSFSGSEQQGAMTVDGYMPQEQKNIIGLSLYFHGEQQNLVMVNIMPNPLVYDEKILDLINKSLDSVDATGEGPSRKAKLYFLGLYPISSSKVIKIMIREDTMNSGPVYSINYAISAT